MLPQCPLPLGSPSRDMTRSPLLAGCKHPQHSPGHQTGVWELCWETRTSLAVSESPRQPGKPQGGGVQVGSEKHMQGVPQHFPPS